MLAVACAVACTACSEQPATAPTTAAPRASTTVPTTASDAPVTTVAVDVPSPTASDAPVTTVPRVRERPFFVEGAVPGWPFHGVVQLWPDFELVRDAEGSTVGLRLSWSLLYWSWDASPDGSYPQVELPGLEIECLGRAALVHDERGGAEPVDRGPRAVVRVVARTRWR